MNREIRRIYLVKCNLKKRKTIQETSNMKCDINRENYVKLLIQCELTRKFGNNIETKTLQKMGMKKVLKNKSKVQFQVPTNPSQII